jgi:hypothetical protein
MSRPGLLVAVSAAQLIAGTAGHLLALKRRLAYDIAPISWRGQPRHVGRDSWLMGTALSAPVVMLAAQAAATARLATSGGGPAAARTLGVLGATMVGGYLLEREVRTVLTPSHWDPAETPVVVAGAGLALAMARLGLSG